MPCAISGAASVAASGILRDDKNDRSIDRRPLIGIKRAVVACCKLLRTACLAVDV